MKAAFAIFRFSVSVAFAQKFLSLVTDLGMTPRKIGAPPPPRLLVGIWLGLSSESLFLLARRAIVDDLAVASRYK